MRAGLQMRCECSRVAPAVCHSRALGEVYGWAHSAEASHPGPVAPRSARVGNRLFVLAESHGSSGQSDQAVHVARHANRIDLCDGRGVVQCAMGVRAAAEVAIGLTTGPQTM